MTTDTHEHITGTTIAIPFKKLTISAKNVRTINTGKQADADFYKSILTLGLLQNMVVVEAPNDTFGVIAGGRRFAVLTKMHSDGIIKDDTIFNCNLRPKGSEIETSLAENEDRASMHPADRFRAYQSMVDEGKSTETIASTYAVSVSQVKKLLRLANVHKSIFDQFAKDNIDFEQIAAYAVTSDNKHQLSVFKSLGINASAWAIKKAITDGQASGDSKRVKYVTLKAYIEAGGVVEDDLLGDSTYLKDPDILNDLAIAKLQKAAARETGWKWVDVALDPPTDLYSMRRINKTLCGVPNASTKALEKLQTQIDALYDSEDELTDAQEKQLAKAEESYDNLNAELRKKYERFTDSDKAHAGCVVVIGHNGKSEYHRGVQRPADYKLQQKQLQPDSKQGDSSDKSKASDQCGLSQSLKNDLQLTRRSAIRTYLMRDRALAATVLNYSLCCRFFVEDACYGSVLIDARFQSPSNEPSLESDPHNQSAAEQSKLLAKLNMSWVKMKSSRKRFEAFQALPKRDVQAMVAYCVGLMLEEGMHHSDGKDAIDAVVDQLSVDISALWRPSDESYFSRLTIDQLIQHGVVFYGKRFTEQNTKAKKRDLVALLHGFFHGDSDELTSAQKTLRDTWLPDLIK